VDCASCWLTANFSLTFANHRAAIGITFGSPDRLYIKYIRILSPIYQYVIDLVMSIPIRKVPDVLMFRCGNICS